MRNHALNLDWSVITEKLAYRKEKDDEARRKKMFRKFDPNLNGFLSIDEVFIGMRDLLRLDNIMNIRPAIFRAFYFAKN